MNLQLQDFGDGRGLDVLDEDGLLVQSGLSRVQALEFFEGLEAAPDATIVRVLGGALDRERDEEVMLDDLIEELDS